MTENERAEHIRRVVGEFAAKFWHDRAWQLGQMIPNAQTALSADWVPVTADEWLTAAMEPQEWLTMARAAAGLVPATDDNRAYVREICQSLAEWLFAYPGGGYSYSIPDSWYESEMGSLWATALIWCTGDELVPLAEAARRADIPLTTLASRVDRGSLRAYIDPFAASRQGRRLVRMSDVETEENE